MVADNRPRTFAWTAALAVSYAAIMFTAPVIGAYADAYAAKKKLLALTTIGCVAFTALLVFSGPDSLWLTIILIVLSNFFYGSGENLIAAFLPELATGRALGKVSGWGWSLGYVGGLNNKIRVIQRRAYGLRDEEHLRLKILTSLLPAL